MKPGILNFRSNRTRKGVRSAFTLPEVLATLVLVGIVLPIVMNGLSIALKSSAHARHTAEAASLGEAKLMDLVSTMQWSSGMSSGDFGADWPGYEWSSQTITMDYSVDEVDLKVTWTERGQEQSLVLSTMVYDNSSVSTSSDTTLLP